MTRARSEAQWLLEALVRPAQVQSVAELSGAWSVGRPRVEALDQQLVVLGANAPDEAGAAQVTTLLAAVRASQQALESHLRSADIGTLDALNAAGQDLDSALAPPEPPAAG